MCRFDTILLFLLISVQNFFSILAEQDGRFKPRGEIFRTAFVAPRHQVVRPCSVLVASKKKGGSQASTSSKKIQVKMLKYVSGTGQKGDVVMVTPAFFQNKLRPTQSAQIISDDEVDKERAAAAALEKETKETAQSLKEEIEKLELVLPRKAGPDGQLFGGVGPKTIMEELKKKVDNSFLDNKGVKIQALFDVDGKKMRGDIKHTGEFQSTVSLTKDIIAKFEVVVKTL